MGELLLSLRPRLCLITETLYADDACSYSYSDSARNSRPASVSHHAGLFPTFF